ncbi:MAG: GDSL-type esterase/lipase family protein [Verrucomicrobiales bacterium]
MKRSQFALLLLSMAAGGLPAIAKDGKARSAVKIACVGDSITYGAGIKQRETSSYPSQLGKLLGADFQVRNFGVSGATLMKKGNHPYWKTNAYESALSWKPDIVVIKLGTNDTKPGNWKHHEGLAGDLEEMIRTFRGLPTKPKIFLCLPAPAFPERWGIRDSVIKNELIPIIRRVAKEQRCPTIDIYSALEGKDHYFPDKIHPNKDGATVIAKSVYSALKIAAPAAAVKQPATPAKN